jgi:hypothetical protein
MKRLLVPLSLGVFVAACSDAPTSNLASKTIDAARLAAAAAAQPVNPVIEWNRIVLTIVRTPNAQPATIHSTWDFAILHASIYDAVNSITRRHQPYKVQLTVSPDASQDAAVISAGHEVLTNLYEDFRPKLDSIAQAELAAIPESKAKQEGIRVGRKVADSILALRAGDGHDATPPLFDITGAPGTWQPTPPNFPPQPQLTQWPNVKLFVLNSPVQFPVAGPPPALTSQTFINDFIEIRRDGILGGAAISADQRQAGQFWNGNIQDYWQEITQTAAIGHNLNVEETAHLFALLDLTLADDAITYFWSKYQFGFWRPVTAIREAGALKNPQLIPDTTWLPLVTKTTPDPSYPAAHSDEAYAAAEILINFFATNTFSFGVTSEVLPGVTRSFTTFTGAAQDAADSRIWGGQHFRNDVNAGHEQGFQVARYIVHNVLR